MEAKRIKEMGQGSHLFILIDSEKYKVIRQQKTGILLLSKCESPYSNMFDLEVDGETIIISCRITTTKRMTHVVKLKEVTETRRE